jgi:hypothetical protein
MGFIKVSAGVGTICGGLVMFCIGFFEIKVV